MARMDDDIRRLQELLQTSPFSAPARALIMEIAEARPDALDGALVSVPAQMAMSGGDSRAVLSQQHLGDHDAHAQVLWSLLHELWMPWCVIEGGDSVLGFPLAVSTGFASLSGQFQVGLHPKLRMLLRNLESDSGLTVRWRQSGPRT